jgi:hypothetical protein
MKRKPTMNVTTNKRWFHMHQMAKIHKAKLALEPIISNIVDPCNAAPMLNAEAHW